MTSIGLRSRRNSEDNDEEFGTVRGTSVRTDPFVASQLVLGLCSENFDSFLRNKEVAMVMFYLRDDQHSSWARKHFKKAAETTMRQGHVYAAIDCDKNSDLCLDEGVAQFPHFKIYSRGEDVGFNSDARHFFHQDMRTWVEGFPVFPSEDD